MEILHSRHDPRPRHKGQNRRRLVVPTGAGSASLANGGAPPTPRAPARREMPSRPKRFARKARVASSTMFNMNKNSFNHTQESGSTSDGLARISCPCIKHDVADMSHLLEKRPGLAHLERNSLKNSGFLISPWSIACDARPPHTTRLKRRSAMKKLLSAASLIALALSAGSALAADLPYRKEEPVYVPPPPPAVTWNGRLRGREHRRGLGRRFRQFQLLERLWP